MPFNCCLLFISVFSTANRAFCNPPVLRRCRGQRIRVLQVEVAGSGPTAAQLDSVAYVLLWRRLSLYEFCPKATKVVDHFDPRYCGQEEERCGWGEIRRIVIAA